MKYNMFMMSLISILVVLGYFLYSMYPQLGDVSQMSIIYGVMLIHLGAVVGIFVAVTFCKKYMVNAKAYKRELEKESIAGDEASAQIKVLKSKIEVLEKALEQALNK